MKQKVIILFSLFAFPFLTLSAQCPTQNTAFKAGERLTYDLYFNWKFIWVKCGSAFYTMKSANYKNQPALRNDLLFTSNKRCDAFFTMRDTLISYITPDLVPLYFRKGSLEGKHYTVDEVWYTYSNGKSHVKQHFLNRHGEWSEHHHESQDCNYDMLSILSLARSFDPANYKVGQRIHFPMATGKKVEEQTLVYRGKRTGKPMTERSITACSAPCSTMRRRIMMRSCSVFTSPTMLATCPSASISTYVSARPRPTWRRATNP